MKIIATNRVIFDSMKNESFTASCLNMFVNKDADWKIVESLLTESLKALKTVKKNQRRLNVQIIPNETKCIAQTQKELDDLRDLELKKKLIAAKLLVEAQLKEEVKPKDKVQADENKKKKILLLEEQSKLAEQLKALENVKGE